MHPIFKLAFGEKLINLQPPRISHGHERVLKEEEKYKDINSFQRAYLSREIFPAWANKNA